MKLLKFYAPWCGQCKALERRMTDVNFNVPVIGVNVDEDEEKANKYNVTSLPTLILIDDNDNMLCKWHGNINFNEIKKKINERGEICI